MNKDRRVTCKVLGDVCASFAKTPSNKVLFALKDSVEDLVSTEQRSIDKMEPHCDKPVTKMNHRMATRAKYHLELAADALVEGDMEEASDQLMIVAESREEEEEESTTNE